ncbi:hypothetical protein AVT69_gp234 [Pseudomonas phage PhiPA3]|uniref:Uncharacterized protein 236 n=1 Tax=Pseudomonas phage PhiPA3 TaxID=998086 RepID=F8SJ79_BPPA3|nr:hypothetical protein AVT69_gp234 [Pseudomonas phage PhiPA3]AEH03659.1 hypothetical protein [Pseudomonas phage PhiPA3]
MIRLNLSSFGTVSSIKIYRGSVRVNSITEVVEPPIATLAAGTTTWDDTTAVKDTVYHYYIVNVLPDSRTVAAMRRSFAIAEYTNPGPGGTTPLLGDFWNGYFGTVAFTSIVDRTAFRSQLALSTGNFVDSTNLPVNCHKFQVNGKTIYIPDHSFFSGVNWKATYEAGIMFPEARDYFSDLPSTVTSTLTATVQGKTYTNGSNVYKVYAPSLGDRIVYTDLTDAATGMAVIGDQVTSTIDRVYTVQSSSFVYSWLRDKYNSQDITTSYNRNSGFGVTFQVGAVLSNGQAVQRGTTTNFGTLASTTTATGGTTRGYLPFLELVR